MEINVSMIENRYSIKVLPGQILIDRLKSRIAGFEKQFNMSSVEMIASVHSGILDESEEVSRWLQDYQVLERISNNKNGKKQIGMAGTLLRTTNKSTTPV